LPLETFHTSALPYYPEAVHHLDLEKVSKLIQLRIEQMTAIPEVVHFLSELPRYDLQLFENPKSKSTLDSSLKVLQEALPRLEDLTEWDNASLFESLKTYANQSNLKVGTVMWPIRTALSGLPSTPGGATELAELLGKHESLVRLRSALKMLEKS